MDIARNKILRQLGNEAIQSFIENIGEGGDNKTSFKFMQLAQNLFSNLLADLSMLRTLTTTAEKALPVEQITVYNFSDDSRNISWKNFSKYLNSMIITRIKIAEKQNQRDATTSTPCRNGGGSGGHNDDDDADNNEGKYPAFDDDEEICQFYWAKKNKSSTSSGKGKGKKKMNITATM